MSIGTKRRTLTLLAALLILAIAGFSNLALFAKQTKIKYAKPVAATSPVPPPALVPSSTPASQPASGPASAPASNPSSNPALSLADPRTAGIVTGNCMIIHNS